MPFLPTNPYCPGCGSTDPCGCTDPRSDLKGSDQVKYTGPTLPCTGITTCDTLTVALQKIDEKICEILAAIATTTTTTSTSTAAPVTTTTTTEAPITTTTTTEAPTTTTTTTEAPVTTTTTTEAPATTTTTTTAEPVTTTTTTTAEPVTTTTTTAAPTTTTTTTAEPTTTTTTTAAPTFSTFLVYRDEVGTGWADSGTACAATATGSITLYSNPGSTTFQDLITNGHALYTDQGLTSAYVGGSPDNWYKSQTAPGGISLRIDDTGFIDIALVTC